MILNHILFIIIWFIFDRLSESGIVTLHIDSKPTSIFCHVDDMMWKWSMDPCHEDRWQQGFINDRHFCVLTIALFGKDNKKIQSEYLCHNSVYLKNLGFRIATPVSFSFLFFFFDLGDVKCEMVHSPLLGKLLVVRYSHTNTIITQ